MAWWQQVCRGVVRQKCTATSPIMNCSCLQQRRGNRLTCYRNSTGISSSHRVALPLLITLAILMLAMPLIDAAALKRSVAETSTDVDFTTAISIDEVDFTTVVTPHLANTQASASVNILKQNVTAADVKVSIVNETDGTSEVPITIQENNQTILLGLPQDVNNEISQVTNEESATKTKGTIETINPKFDYTETLLTGTLEEAIRNSVKNEIEFEHDIGVAAAERLQAVTDLKERQKLSDEVLAIQNAQRQGNIMPSEAVGVLKELISSTPDDKYHEHLALATESSLVGYSTTAQTDLSIYFPIQAEDRSSTEKSHESNLIDPRNADADVTDNLEMTEVTEDAKVRTMKKKQTENVDESLREGKSLVSKTFSHIAEAALDSHETNEITEESSKAQLDIDSSQKVIDDHSDENQRSADVEMEEKPKDEENKGSSFVDLNGSLMTAQENHSNIGNENVDLEAKEESAAPAENTIDSDTSQLTPAASDEASLSIVLNENLAATEPAEALEDDQTEDIVHLEENNRLLSEEVAETFVEPTMVKSVHIVIKKPGVEIDDAKIEPLPNEVVEETTISVDFEQEAIDAKNNSEKDETVVATAASIVEDENLEEAQGIQNDDNVNETTPQIVLNINGEDATEALGVSGGSHAVEINKPIDIEDEKSVEDNNRIDSIHNERNHHNEQPTDESTDYTTNELDADFKETLGASENEYLTQTNNELEYRDEKSTTSHDAVNASSVTPTAEPEPVVTPIVEDDSALFQTISITEQIEQTHSTTHTPNIESTPKEFEAYVDESNNTDDPEIVPILVGVGAGQGDVTASTKGSRSINTQTHHSMLLRQMDDALDATLVESYLPHNAGQTFNDHLADESRGGIGKPLPARSVSQATSASLFSRSGLIILLCSAIALMFLLASVAAFLVSFQRQHGTLDIEMQEQRCGKDNLDDDEEEEAGTCTKLLDIELPKSSIVTVSCEEMEECL